MQFNYFKITTVCALDMALAAMSNVVFAQVFAPQANKVSNITKQTSNFQKEAPVQTTKPEIKQPTDESDAVKINQNFSETQKEIEYDNRTPKIVSFKIVNGEVILDDTKKRSILVYYDNYQVHRGLDEYVRCSLRVYVLNDLTEKINSLGFKLYWPDISTSVQMSQLNPGVRSYKDIMLMGDGCFALDQAPTVEVNRCRVKSMSQEECADAVKWYEKPQK